MVSNTEIALVLFIGCNLVFIIWLWYRARPGSGERLFLPTFMLLSVSMLVGILPRVLWPNAERVKIGGSIASMILSTVATIGFFLRSRRLRTGGRHG